MMEYLHFSQIHEGDLLYEEGPFSLQVKVLTEPKQSGDQWTFEGETKYGGVNYLMTEGLSHYGPQLTRRPTRLEVHLLDGNVQPLFDVEAI